MGSFKKIASLSFKKSDESLCGSWASEAKFLYSGITDLWYPEDRDDEVGFRLVRTVRKEEKK